MINQTKGSITSNTIYNTLSLPSSALEVVLRPPPFLAPPRLLLQLPRHGLRVGDGLLLHASHPPAPLPCRRVPLGLHLLVLPQPPPLHRAGRDQRQRLHQEHPQQQRLLYLRQRPLLPSAPGRAQQLQAGVGAEEQGEEAERLADGGSEDEGDMGEEAEVGELGEEAQKRGDDGGGGDRDEGPTGGGWGGPKKEDWGEGSRGEDEEEEVEGGEEEAWERRRAARPLHLGSHGSVINLTPKRLYASWLRCERWSLKERRRTGYVWEVDPPPIVPVYAAPLALVEEEKFERG